MGGRVVQLSGEAGINRLKAKGGPPKNALYDLLNGYIDATGCAVSRPGTVEAYQLPAGSRGLCSHNGGLVVFSHDALVGVPTGVTLAILKHPTEPSLSISTIHFAGPFLGYLYVVAEFDGGSIYHYWLQPVDAWEANTVYTEGSLVRASTDNGYSYEATRLGEPYPLWAPDVVRELGDRVEPTTANGYYYEVVQLIEGGTATSGGTSGGGTSGGGLGSGDSVGAGVSYGDTTGSAPYAGTITASGGYLGGYVGVPYHSSTMYSGESVRPVVGPYNLAEPEWIGTPPPGLSAAAFDTFMHGYPSAGGVPTTAGAYSWTTRMSEVLAFGVIGTTTDVPVSVTILPAPTFAVIDPSQRSQYNVGIVDDSPKPLMHARVGRPGPSANIVPATAITTPGATTGDFYAEVTFVKAFNGTSRYGGIRTAWMGVAGAAPQSDYRGGAIDITNPTAPPDDVWLYTTRQTGTATQINDGDIGMIYGQPSTGKLWFGVNGTWVNGGNPTTGDNPYATDLALAVDAFGGAFRILAGGYGDRDNVRDEFIINCGNAAFTYTPPNAVTGTPYLARDREAQFDSQNRSPLVQLQNLGAVSGVVVARVRDDYTGSDFGSAVCEIGHSTGKRQFEMHAYDTGGDKVWMGAVRSSFDPTVLTSRVGLANTVGARPWTTGSTDGEIAVNGVTSVCGTGNAINSVFTFALDLDADTFEVYVDGVLSASGSLPVAAAEWFPAMSGQTGSQVRLRTLDLVHPVATYTDWAA